jgi:hypothetical protein
MSPRHLTPSRLLVAVLALGAFVLGSGACNPYTEDIGEPSVRPPGSPSQGNGGQTPDGTNPDGGQPQDTSGDVLLKLLAAKDAYTVQTRYPVSDAFLGTSAAQLASGGYVVTSVTPSPAGHALVGVKLSDSGSVFEVSSAHSSTGTEASLQTLADDMSSRGYLVTAAAVGSSGTSLLGVRPRGATRTFEARVRKVGNATNVAGEANSLGASGYAVTALTKGADGYLMVGVRQTGATRKYTATTQLTEFTELQAAATALASGGHVLTGLGAEGTKTLLLGVKPTGSTQTYAASVTRVAPSGLTTGVANLAGRGYMLTAMTFDDTNYVLVGLR